jgi:hypothetical protein
MTIKLNTMKTGSFDMNAGATQDFLDSLTGSNDNVADLMKGAQTKITKQ